MLPAPPRPLRALLAATLLAVAPLAVHAAVDDHRAKPIDGNRWGVTRFRSGGLIRGHCARRPCIALTFDDGPEHTTTPLILDELDRHNVRATFFVTGHRIEGDGGAAERNRETLRDAWRRGHLIGNHTHHHGVMDQMNEATLAREIDRAGDLIEQAIGARTYLFRAPFGALQTPRARSAVYSRGLTPVFWGIDTRDWASRGPEEVLANFRAGLDASPRGGVVLFHDTLARTTQALPAVFAEIEARNRARRAQSLPVYEFVGLEELWEPIRARARAR